MPAGTDNGETLQTHLSGRMRWPLLGCRQVESSVPLHPKWATVIHSDAVVGVRIVCNRGEVVEEDVVIERRFGTHGEMTGMRTTL